METVSVQSARRVSHAPASVRRAVRLTRWFLGHTQRTLARAARVGTSTLSLFENGRYSMSEQAEAGVIETLLRELAAKYGTEAAAATLPVCHLRARLLGTLALVNLQEVSNIVAQLPVSSTSRTNEIHRGQNSARRNMLEPLDRDAQEKRHAGAGVNQVVAGG